MTNGEQGNRELVDFHRTISEQLNARLSESPRFFWAVALSVTAYGYVLWNKPEEKIFVFLTVSVVAYMSILWATWYLAALGYAFRYLQNSQHRIEDKLGWQEFRTIQTGIPPTPPLKLGEYFWLLPGIYHAHLAGLNFIGVVLQIVYFFKFYLFYKCQEPNVIFFSLYFLLLTLIFQIYWMFQINRYYLDKFRTGRVR